MQEFSLKISLDGGHLSLHCPELAIAWDEHTPELTEDYPHTVKILRDEILAALYDKIQSGEISEATGIALLGGEKSYFDWYADRMSELAWDRHCEEKWKRHYEERGA
jgi:hypothetical protein